MHAQPHIVVVGSANVDLTTLPPITYASGGPARNSFGDILARLYHALLNGKLPNAQPPQGGMRTEVSLSYPLIPGAPATSPSMTRGVGTVFDAGR